MNKMESKKTLKVSEVTFGLDEEDYNPPTKKPTVCTGLSLIFQL
jgi:hypothetical protein